MIIDHIRNRNLYSNNKKIHHALCMLVEKSESMLLDTSTDDIKFLKILSSTKPLNQCSFESHKRYIDIHYILTGFEKISITSIDNLSPKTKYNEKDDIILYRENTDCHISSICLSPGMFIVCFPSEAHRVGEEYHYATEVEKFVVKIRA